MDLPSLAAVLQAALGPNSAERKAAEEHLNTYQYTREYLVRLPQIIVDKNYDLAVRQLASINFKNFIAQNWSPQHPEEQSKIPTSDKDSVRQNILASLEKVPTLLRAQSGECLKTIIHKDYPEQWPRLLHWVTLNLKGQQVFGALFVLHILCRKYEFKSDEERTPVHHIVEDTFPHLLNTLNRLVHIRNPPIEVARSIKLICKIYWFSMFKENLENFFDPLVFKAWMILFLNILERPVPSWGWWKVKKWTIHVLNRVYMWYKDLNLYTPENRAFAQQFERNYAEKILKCHMNLLDAIRVGDYLPDRVTYLILQYLSNSISKTVTYNLLQERIDVILFEIIFPLMCFNENDQNLWKDDPHEYVRKGYDIFEDYSPRAGAMYFVSELVEKGGKEYLYRFILSIVEVFKRHGEAPVWINPYWQKDGALLAIGTLSDKVKQTKPLKSMLEHMLVQHVFPEFNSPVGHIRAKAIWVAGQYANIDFFDRNNFRKALQSTIAGMRDLELPVRVDSVFAVCSFVGACDDVEEMKPVLPQLLDELLKVTNEVENQDLASTLETIAYKFEEEMEPYAVDLCQNLAAAFTKSTDTAETEDDFSVAAFTCLSAINTILESVSELPHLLAQIEPILFPVMHRMLTINEELEFDKVSEMISYMTFSSTISMEMWSLWPLLMDVLTKWDIIYLSDIQPLLENYISRSTMHYLTCKEPDYQQSLWIMLSKVMGVKNLEDEHIEPAPMLMSLVLQDCKGKVDNWVEPYITITIERLHRAYRPYFKCLLIQVIADALYYDASLTLNILKKFNVATEFFNQWFQLLEKTGNSGMDANFKSINDKKVCCLGLTSLLSLADELPGEVLERVYKATLKLLVAYKDQVAEEKEETEDDDDDDDMSDDWQTDDDEVDGSNNEMGVDDYDDEELKSSIDKVDPFVFFVDTVKDLQASDAMSFENMLQKLDLHYQEMAKGVAESADETRAT